MASLRKRGRVWYFRFVDVDGKKRERKGCSDRRATEQMAAAAEAKVAKIREGLIDARDLNCAGHGARPLGDHLQVFVDTMEAAGRNSQHIAQTRLYITRIIELSHARRIADLTPSAVMQALGTLRSRGFSARSLNAHTTAIKAFSRWLWRDGRVREHTLAHLATSNPESDRRRVRRALGPEEAARLVSSAEQGPEVMGMSGRDRAMLYTVAMQTGFRRKELRSLDPASFRLDVEPPLIVCEAVETKNGHRAEQPISKTLADLLRPWLAGLPPGRPAFAMPVRVADMLSVDLERAGIPKSTPSGTVDLHSLRVTYISNLVSSGASVKTCQVLARHSTPNLTIGVYAKATIHDLAGAVNALPDLGPDALPTKPADAKETEGQPINDHLAHYLPTAGDGSGRTVADAVAMVRDTIARPKPCSSKDLSVADGLSRDGSVRVADGIRTRDPQIHNRSRREGRTGQKPPSLCLKLQDFLRCIKCDMTRRFAA
jgi:site-specific recombinase XerC